MSHEPAEMMPKRYSQNDEQDWIFRLTEGMTGSAYRVLDVGAHDGRTFSNSLGLIELRGWCGVLVEPSPGPMRACMELHKDRASRVTCVCAALAEASGPLPIHLTDDMLSTQDARHAGVWAPQVAYTRALVGGVSWQSLLLCVCPLDLHFDVVSIDVEGCNAKTLAAMPEHLRPGVLVIESTPQDDAGPELARRGYVIVHRTPENLIAVPACP